MRKYKKRRKKLHTRKIFLLNSILVVFLFLGIGYSLLSTELTINGSTKVKEYFEPTLYNVLKKEAISSGLAKEYTGSHQDSMDASKSTEKIYHWYGRNDTEGTAILDKNNVLFAGQCWQMIRTTDTGGVKMIYNGEAEDGKCLNTRGTHVGYASRTSQDLASAYWYGTDYTYDSTAKTFKVSGTTEQTTWNATTGPGLIGKYTCKSANEDGSCSTLYLVESYNNASNAYVIPLNSNSDYAQFGKLQFNAKNSLPTYFGYMYEDVYVDGRTDDISNQKFTTTQTVLGSTSLSTTYWYADSIDYGNLTANRYSLVDPYQVNATTDYANLVGKYTFRSSNGSYTNSSVYYIAAVNNTTMYYVQLKSGNLLSAYNPIVFGDSITDNGNGTYTIDNPVPVSLTDWYTNYANYVNKYTCNDSNTSCTNPRYVTEPNATKYTYISVAEKIMIGKGRSSEFDLTDTLLVSKGEWYTNFNNYSDYIYTCNTDSAACTEEASRLITSYRNDGYNYSPNRYYGSSVTWDGTNYTLVDPIVRESDDSYRSFLDKISTHHYMCVSPGLKTCPKVAYVHGYSGAYMWYTTLKDGVTSILKALEDMLTKNVTNSVIKSGVDAWYKHYLLENYDDYIEDTIFCNDRSILTLNSWDPDGGKTDTNLQLKESNPSTDLSCANTTDQFSVSNDSAKLTYKVGLMSSPEMNILNNSNARKTGQYYWLASPNYFGSYGAYGRRVYTSGDMSTDRVDVTYGVRPAVSLTPGTRYSSGDGSMANPYIVDAEAHHYVYSTSSGNTKGALESELGSTYRTDIEAINGFNKRVVLNHKIENDRVTSSGVTFERNGIIYTLYGEGATYNDSTGEYNEDSINYEINKQTLNDAFGENNCTEYTTQEKYYQCIDGNEIGAARASGRVGVEINRWFCRDYSDGTFQCISY